MCVYVLGSMRPVLDNLFLLSSEIGELLLATNQQERLKHEARIDFSRLIGFISSTPASKWGRLNFVFLELFAIVLIPHAKFIVRVKTRIW